MFTGFILSRILFVACMVFIIGYVFGNFSKSATLKTITKVASVLLIVIFISANVFFFRFGGWNGHNYNGKEHSGCYQQIDSTRFK
jgi:hypothetical protein